MPLFGHKNAEPVPATHAPPPTTHRATRTSTSSADGQKRGFFSRRRSSSSSSDELRRRNNINTADRHSTSNSGGLFHRNNHVADPALAANHNNSSGGGLFHRNSAEDPSISSARQRVVAAEAAEHDADRALHQARAAVKDARDHVRLLEKEAAEEARLAKIKQHQAADISKRAKPLGRHGRF